MKAERKATRTKRAQPSATSPPGIVAGEWVRPGLLAVLVALAVARPLLPSEGVSWIGDGQPFNLAWLILASAYLLWTAMRGGPVRRWNAVDIAVSVLVAASVISCVLGVNFLADTVAEGSPQGSPRLVTNMLWEWVALGLVFHLTRQLVRTAVEARVLAAVMVALAVALSVYGFYQVFVTLPADRAAYAANPEELLRNLNQWSPPGSPERARFESRLASTEPLSTFALTNSLAGFLAAWLVVGLGVGLNMIEMRRTAPHSSGATGSHSVPTMAHVVGLGLCLLLVGGCFVLTKSRSAYVALIVGIGLLPFTSARYRRILDRRLVLIAAVALVALVIGAIAVRGLDAPVLSEASKSLGYRLEYWRSTLGMIRHHFWLGVGPGSFQDFYTQYKLPEASEEIRDPHNLLLEVWATSGIFALAALCVAIGGVLWRAWRAPEAIVDADATPRVDSPRTVRFMLAGGVAGLSFAFLVGPLVGMVLSEEQFVGGLVVGILAIAIEWPWIRGGLLPARLPALALAVLAINLLAAGGIAYPGVAYSLWILAALALNESDPVGAFGAAAASGRARLGLLGAAAAAVAASVLCYTLACGPVVLARAKMTDALEAESTNPVVAPLFWLEAGNADPWSPDPWTALAEIELGRLERNPADQSARNRFVNASNHLHRVARPHSSAVVQQIARWMTRLYRVDHDPKSAASAATFMRRAVALYPNSPTVRGEYALALVDSGQADSARRQAAVALDLDGRTPHADKKLSDELKQKLETLAAEQEARPDPPAETTAEP